MDLLLHQAVLELTGQLYRAEEEVRHSSQKLLPFSTPQFHEQLSLHHMPRLSLVPDSSNALLNGLMHSFVIIGIQA